MIDICLTMKMKVESAIDERPDLFEGVGEATHERLAQLISTIPLIEKRLGQEIDHWKKYVSLPFHISALDFDY